MLRCRAGCPAASSPHVALPDRNHDRGTGWGGQTGSGSDNQLFRGKGLTIQEWGKNRLKSRDFLLRLTAVAIVRSIQDVAGILAWKATISCVSHSSGGGGAALPAAAYAVVERRHSGLYAK